MMTPMVCVYRRGGGCGHRYDEVRVGVVICVMR